MIKQIDLLRNRSLAKMKAKDNKTKLEGLGDLARYLAIVGGGNASVGTVRITICWAETKEQRPFLTLKITL